MVVLASLAIAGFIFITVATPNLGANAASGTDFSNVTDRFAGQRPQAITVAANYDTASLKRDSFSASAPPAPAPSPTASSSATASTAGVAAPAAEPVAPAAPPASPGTAQAYAQSLLASYGMGADQFGCLVALWDRESGWNVHAANPSGAYGIPQALPGSKMSSAGPDWQDSYQTQVTWGLNYVRGVYGTPCGAWGHSQAVGWY